jgi:hypothetical protein
MFGSEICSNLKNVHFGNCSILKNVQILKTVCSENVHYFFEIVRFFESFRLEKFFQTQKKRIQEENEKRRPYLLSGHFRAAHEVVCLSGTEVGSRNKR